MCEPKDHGGKRCDSCVHLARGTHLVAKTAEIHAGVHRQQVKKIITQVRREEARLAGVRPVVETAAPQAVQEFINQEKESIMSDSKISDATRESMAQRWDQVAEAPRVPLALLRAWQRVTAWARSGLLRTLGAGLLVSTLAACSAGGGSPAEPLVTSTVPGTTQSAPAQPGGEATEAPAVVDNETSFAVDAASISVPQDVVDNYGPDLAGRLGSDALATASLANEIAELHHARTGSEVEYWTVYRESMTPELWNTVSADVTAYEAGDAAAGDRLAGLAPYAERDGSLATVDGVSYAAGEQGISIDITGTPTVSLSDAGRVAVDLPQTARAYAADGSVLVFSMNKVLYFTPSASGWLLDSYAPRNVSDVIVERGE